MCTERKATGQYVLACFLSATMKSFLTAEFCSANFFERKNVIIFLPINLNMHFGC